MENNDKPNLLEFQDPQNRSSRVEELLASTPSRSEQTINLPPKSLEELRSASLPVNHDLLSRLEAFLPAMHESTQQLQQQAQSDPSSLDIEHLDPSTQEYIEMNLGLGVYESRPNQSHTTSSSDSDSDASSDSDSTSDSDSGSGSESDDERPDVLSILMRAVPPVPRTQPPPDHPNIVMLQSSSPEPSRENNAS